MLDKIINRIAYLKKQIEKTEFSKKTPIWEWEKMCLELESLTVQLKEELG